LELQRGSRSSNEFGEETDDTLIEHLTSIEACHSQRSDKSRANILDALEFARECGLIEARDNSNAPPENASVGHVPVHERFPEQESSWHKNYEARKLFWRKAAKATVGVVPADNSGAETQPHQGGIQDRQAFREEVQPALQSSLRDVDMILNREPQSAQPTPASVQEIIESQQLNVEQARAFSIVANHSQSGKDEKPLRMYLGGQGGTGKSRVIDALRDFFVGIGQSRRFRLSSFTGVAARNISGMTLHAALMLGDGIFSSARSSKSKQDLMAMWEGVDYLFIDEISMVGCSFLYDISHALSVAKGNDLAFGGINVVFAGDFAQLPPVRQVRLYSHLDSAAISKAATKNGQKVVFGKLLWLSVNTVVILTENMRQSGPENQRFVELLGRLRDGRCTQSDYEL
jgi:hypothetical protein